MGLSTREEYEEYSCPGAYRPPKDPQRLWPTQWAGWDDWLGTPLAYDEARRCVRAAALRDEDGYRAFVAEHPGGERLPARPDRYYAAEWTGWEEFLLGPL